MLEAGNTLGQMWLRETSFLGMLYKPWHYKDLLQLLLTKSVLLPAQLSRRPHQLELGQQGREGERKEK